MKKRCDGCFAYYDDEFELCPYCGRIPGGAPPEAYQLNAGTVLEDRYVIGNVLGFGGFGITYKAWDRKLEAVVAIKEYYPSGLVNRAPGTSNVMVFVGRRKKEFEYGLIRFLDEAKNMCKFNTHKSIVNVYEYFEENNTAYIVMEFLDGCTLGEYMNEKSGKLSVDESLNIMESVCSALSDIHESGIIHRDISPDNIYMCKNGVIKIIDFGAARFSASEDEKKYTIVLKPGFAPPEQYEQISVQGPWTDIYALGATLYYMVTGEKPEESTNRRIKDTLADPREIDPSIPEFLALSILKAMAIDRHMRFANVKEFEKAVKREKKVVSLKKEKSRRKAKRFSGILAGVLVLTFIASIFYTQMGNEALQPASIEFWYPQIEGVDCDESYSQIVKDFNEAYDNVKINAVGIPQADYANKVTEALKNGKAPDLFYSNGIDESLLKDTADLTDVVYPQSGTVFYKLTSFAYKKTLDNCDLYKGYTDYCPQAKWVPTSFNIPVVYVNTSLTDFADEAVKDLDSLRNSKNAADKMVILINKDNVDAESVFDAEMLKNADVKYGTIDDFVNGNAVFYISDTSEFYDVRSVGTYAVAKIDADELLCEFNDMLSVASTKESNEMASKKFIQFLVSYNAQNKLYGSSGKIKAIPVSGDAIKTFAETFPKMSFIADDTGNYIFKQTEK